MADRDAPSLPGDPVPDDVVHELKRNIAHLTQRPPNTGLFAGSQPVLFCRDHLNTLLLQRDYFVCEKSDGLRVLMLILEKAGEQGVFLTTRAGQFVRLPGMRFPRTRHDLNLLHNGTLVDGELLWEARPDGSKELRLLLFDALAVNQKPLLRSDYNKRLGYLDRDLIKPLFELARQHPKEVAAHPFKVRMKQLSQALKLPKVFAELRNLAHVSDGLIFTPDHSPYLPGTDQLLLKWKPAEENTIDFRVRLEFGTYVDEGLPSNHPDSAWVDYDSKPAVTLQMWLGRDEHEDFAPLALSDEEWEAWKARGEPLQHRIAECNKVDGLWRFLRWRDDKTAGNHQSSVEKILQSIDDGVTQEELIAAAPAILAGERARREPAQAPPPKRQQQQPTYESDSE